MNLFDFSFFQGFLGNLFATVIGVIIGIPVAFWINRRVEAITERDKRQQIKSTLTDELTLTHNRISLWIKDGKKGLHAVIILVQSIDDQLWRSLSNGGELQWIKDPKLLVVLSNTYTSMRNVRNVADKYHDALIHEGTLTSKRDISVLEKHLQVSIEATKDLIQISLSMLKE